MKKRTGNLCLLLLFLLITSASHAQETKEQIPSDLTQLSFADAKTGSDNGRNETKVSGFSGRDLSELSLDELLNTPVKVVTRSSISALEAPGIITVVTRDEIIASGARDLIDVLLQVPGLHFGMDNQNFVSLGVRGVWAQEGKILLLVDGQEFNEPYYSNLEFGNHFPVDQIQRIEIIRGPGSVIYGGYAELGVINVITRGADDFEGFYVQATYGQMANTYGRRNLSAQYAQKFLNDDLKLSVSVFAGQGHRSDRIYRDFAGNKFDMSHSSELNPSWLNIGFEYRKLQLRFIYDGHRLGMEDGMDSIVPHVMGANAGYFAEARYTISPDEKWEITPRVQFRRSYPWWVTDPESPLFFDYTGDRYSAGVSTWYRPALPVQFNVGLEWYRDIGKLNDTRMIGLQQPLQDGKMKVEYDNIAGYMQVLYNGKPANLSVGARFENHSEYGSSFVPRASVTRVFGPVHIKLLYAKAFRSPSFLNISLGNNIKSENATVVESEIGYQFNENFYAAVNFFDQVIKRPIVYFSGGGDEGYQNFEKTGSSGFEVETRFKYKGGYLNLSYSFYAPNNHNRVDLYDVEGHSNVLRAFPAHKITLNGNFSLSKHFSLSPSVVYTSNLYGNVTGHTELDEDGNDVTVGELGNAGKIVLVNLYATYRDFWQKGLDIGFGVFNIFDHKADYIQPYNSAHAPFPGPSREFVFRLTYNFGPSK
jgi:outer membrane receptor for ferrienterochelin and colicin